MPITITVRWRIRRAVHPKIRLTLSDSNGQGNGHCSQPRAAARTDPTPCRSLLEFRRGRAGGHEPLALHGV